MSVVNFRSHKIRSHHIYIHIICTLVLLLDTSTTVEREKDHSTEADMEKVYVHIQLHSQIDRLKLFFVL